MKKNPLLSLWLSGANSMFGHARSRATAELHRQSALMMAETTKQMMRFWTGAPVAQPRRNKKKR